MHTRVFLSQENPKKYFVLFYEAGCVFSNFFPAEFLADPRKDEQNLKNEKKKAEELEQKLKFNCSEQYFMYRKALMIGDIETAEKMLAETNPMKIKMLGRSLKMSQDDLKQWSRESRDAMYHACLAKFSQNQEQRQMLFRTFGMYNVEASANDKIWGIGLDKMDKRAENPRTWQGSNWLGEVLDKVRNELWDKPEFREDRKLVESEDLTVRIHKLEHFKH